MSQAAQARKERRIQQMQELAMNCRENYATYTKAEISDELAKLYYGENETLAQWQIQVATHELALVADKMRVRK